jgi:polyhydroxyalkanoate synthase
MVPPVAPPPQGPSTSARPRKPAPLVRRLQKSSLRAVQGFVNGVEWLQRDPVEIVNRTPHDMILQEGKLTVRRYRPLWVEESLTMGTEVVAMPVFHQPFPVLLIPPLMVQPWIYDLAPRRSLVKTLLKAGFDVYLVDFGAPDKADEQVTLDNYVLQWVPRAVDAVVQASGKEGLVLYGYCMGGLFALMHVAVHADARVKAIVTIGSPVDAHKMGLLAWLVRVGHKEVDLLSKKLGNVPGPISSAAFRLTSPLKSVTRYSDLFFNLWNDEYVQGFDAVTAWTDHFIDYPGDAFRQLLKEFIKDNKLREGEMRFGDRVADLSRVQCPVQAFAGTKDEVVPVAAAHEVLTLISSKVKEFHEVPGGHMGVFAGREAPRRVWQTSIHWLGQLWSDGALD